MEDPKILRVLESAMTESSMTASAMTESASARALARTDIGK